MPHDPDGKDHRFKKEERKQRTRPCFVLQETFVVAAQKDIARADGGETYAAAAGAPAFRSGPHLEEQPDVRGYRFHGSGGNVRSSTRGNPMGELGAPVTGGRCRPGCGG